MTLALRRLAGPQRDLVISQGKTGYVALYWVDEHEDVVFILALRHQRELDFVP